jgi:hypothetical protein
MIHVTAKGRNRQQVQPKTETSKPFDIHKYANDLDILVRQISCMEQIPGLLCMEKAASNKRLALMICLRVCSKPVRLKHPPKRLEPDKPTMQGLMESPLQSISRQQLAIEWTLASGANQCKPNALSGLHSPGNCVGQSSTVAANSSTASEAALARANTKLSKKVYEARSHQKHHRSAESHVHQSSG